MLCKYSISGLVGSSTALCKPAQVIINTIMIWRWRMKGNEEDDEGEGDEEEADEDNDGDGDGCGHHDVIVVMMGRLMVIWMRRCK